MYVRVCIVEGERWCVLGEDEGEDEDEDMGEDEGGL